MKLDGRVRNVGYVRTLSLADTTNLSATPTLSDVGVDLTDLATRGELDPVHGRDEEVRNALRTLVRRRKNNPCLMGEVRRIPSNPAEESLGSPHFCPTGFCFRPHCAKRLQIRFRLLSPRSPLHEHQQTARSGQNGHCRGCSPDPSCAVHDGTPRRAIRSGRGRNVHEEGRD